MPERLGKYEILRLLGQGAMGEVYLAKDPVLGREVAIKTIKPGGTFGEEVRARFRHEARVVGGLNHPNVVTVFDFGEDEGVHYLVMEYVPGQDLEHLIRSHQVPKAELIELLIQALEGLGAAHAKGIIHRDLKPANILVRTEGRRWVAKLTDFGVAKTEGTALTTDGSFMGTLHYMAPEYLDSGKASATSDLWAFGVMLFEIISSGRKPWPGHSPGPILGGILKDQPAPLVATDWEGLPQGLRGIVKQALTKDPRGRFASAEAFAAALEAALRGAPASLPPLPVPPPPAGGVAAPPRTLPEDAPEPAGEEDHGTDRLLKVGKGRAGQWLSLRVALRQAPAGARVLVLPGVYHEALVVERDIHFVASEPGEVVLQGGAQPAVTVTAGRVRFEGFHFRTEGLGAAVRVEGGVLEASDGRIEAGGEAALDLAGGSAELRGMALEGERGVGLRVGSAAASLTGCSLRGLPGGGLELDREARVKMEDCLVTECGFAGLLAFEGAEVRAERCRFEGNETSGVHAHHGAKVELVACALDANKGYGLSVLKGADVHLSQCSLKQQALAPYIRGRGAASPRLEACAMEGEPAMEP
jgi:hypothetical protein